MIRPPHAARRDALRDGFADSPQAEDAAGLAAHLGRERERFPAPLVGMDVTVGSHQVARAHEYQRERDVGYVVGQYVGRIGYLDIARTADIYRNAVVADDEHGNHFQRGQTVHELTWNGRRPDQGQTADARPHFGNESIAILGRVVVVAGIRVVQRLADE